MTADDQLLYFVGYSIAFIVSVFITRAIFSIPTLIKHQRAQVHLLGEIASQLGVDHEIIKKIYEQNEIKPRGDAHVENTETEQ